MKSRGLARLALLVIPVAGAIAPAAMPQVARAAVKTIAVTTTSDDLSADCLSTDPCSLRSAVMIANNDNNGDIVQLGANTYDLSIPADPKGNDTGLDGDLELWGNMTLQGAGATKTLIRGVGSPWGDRIIEVENQSSSPTVTIQDLKISGGNANGNTTGQPEPDGGGIYSVDSVLTVHNVFVDGNTSTRDGGGIATNTTAAETFTISNSTLSNNIAARSGGGLLVGGTTTGTDSATKLLVTGNTANGGVVVDSGGGGIYNDLGDASGTGTITFTDLMVLGNHAPFMGGGGIYDNSSLLTPGIVPIRRAVTYQRITLANNDAQRLGGGFYSGASVVNLVNATVTKNTVTGPSAGVGNGGGIGAGAIVQLTANVTVNNSTINGNSAPAGGGGAAALQNGDQIHFHNTILVKNTATTGANCFTQNGATIGSTGYNIADDGTCAFAPATDRQGASFNPNLGALLDNTGPLDGAPLATSPTLTEALPGGSIAIDTADPAAANNPATDERGVSRPQGARSDVGAFEALFVAPVLPAAGHPAGGPATTPWLLLALAATVGAVSLRPRALGRATKGVRI